jgi:bifunctional non-homologous end joining protein LigD
VPHLEGRPLTRVRFPNGVDDQRFFEKRCPGHRPKWVKTADVTMDRAGVVDFCLCNDKPTLIWLAQLAALELHPSLSLARRIESPTVVAFDLDPGAPADIIDCCRIGVRLRELFAELGLECFPKTSGSKGLQVYVPLNSKTSYDDTKGFSHAVAQALERDEPDRVVSRQKKELRKGKVLVDWSQNDRNKTTVAVYSLRARDHPTVSTPVQWTEVEEALDAGDPERLRFEPDDVIARIDRHGDLFAPVLELKQSLPRAPA